MDPVLQVWGASLLFESGIIANYSCYSWCFPLSTMLLLNMMLKRCTMYKHRTCTILALKEFHWLQQHSPRKLLQMFTLKTWEIHCLILKSETWSTLLGAWISYYSENEVCSSRMWSFLVLSREQQGAETNNFLKIVESKFVLWQVASQMREKHWS